MKQGKKHEDRQSEYETLEKQLLSLFHSGIYISSYDIVQIGKNIGLDLPFKDRDILLKSLFAKAKSQDNLGEALRYVGLYIRDRANKYTLLGNEYPHARPLISSWLQKAKATDALLKREMARNI